MIKNGRVIIYIVSTLTALLLFSACDSDWDGEVTVTGGTKLPYWITWNDYPGIDGIDVIEVKTPDTAECIFRIKTYNSLVDILTVNRNNVDIDKNEVEKLLGKFNQEFFETKNLIVTQLNMGANTMNVQVDNINKNGIYINETRKFAIVVESVIVWVTIAIVIDSSFITPSSMGVSIR